MFDINNVNTIQLDSANNTLVQLNSTYSSVPLQTKTNALPTEGMGDYYNAYHAVWRNRYDNEIIKQGHEIKPVGIKTIKRAVSFLEAHEHDKLVRPPAFIKD